MPFRLPHLFVNVKQNILRKAKKYYLFRMTIEVQKRFIADKGNNKVGYITYYMFLSFLPLLLVSLTVFDIIFADNERLRQAMIDSTLASIPLIGSTLEANITFVKGHGVTLLVSLGVLLWAAKAGALALHDALNQILLETDSQHSFIKKYYRAYLSMLIISIGIVAPTIITSFVGHTMLTQLLFSILLIVWNSVIIYLIFTIIVHKDQAFGVGVVIGGLLISCIQYGNIIIISNTLDRARPLYGTLAVVLALMVWISLQVRVLLYSAEINVVVRNQRNSPKGN